MDKKKIEIKEERKEKECCCTGDCKKRKIWLSLIIVIVLLGIAFLGGMIVGREYFIVDDTSVNNDINVEKVDDNCSTIDDNNYVIEDYDQYLLNNSSGSAVEDIIFSSNSTMNMSSSIVGAMYSENISDEFKILYSLNNVLTDDFVSESLYSNTKYDDDMNIHFYLNKDTLEKLAKKNFENVSIDDNFKTSNYLGSVVSIECKDGKCEIIASSVGGYTGYFSHYNSKLIKVDYNDRKGLYQYTVSIYYVDFTENDGSSFNVMDKKDGKIYKTITNDQEYSDLFDRYSSCVDKVSTYNYFFKDGKLVSVEKVS